MTLQELRTELEGILRLEEQSSVDWEAVAARCLKAVARLNREPEPPYPHDVVYRFLDDPDVRQKDRDYGEMQRHRLRRWLAGRASYLVGVESGR
jgi:hypothetical protein